MDDSRVTASQRARAARALRTELQCSTSSEHSIGSLLERHNDVRAAPETRAAYEQRLLWLGRNRDSSYNKHETDAIANYSMRDSRALDNMIMAALHRHNNAIVNRSAADAMQLYVDPFRFDPRSLAHLTRLARAQTLRGKE